MPGRDLIKRWNLLKHQMLYRWDNLSQKDIDFIDGRRERFIQVLWSKYGFKRRKAESEIDQFLSENKGQLIFSP